MFHVSLLVTTQFPDSENVRVRGALVACATKEGVQDLSTAGYYSIKADSRSVVGIKPAVWAYLPDMMGSAVGVKTRRVSVLSVVEIPDAPVPVKYDYKSYAAPTPVTVKAGASFVVKE